MKVDVTEPEPPSNCRLCGRLLAPRQKYCRKHKCNQTKVYAGMTLTCQKAVDHTGRCMFMYLGETLETGLR